MKIKLAILEKDQSYLSRIVSVFSTKYADKFEVYSFSDPVIAMSNLDNAKIDVLVSCDAFEVDVEMLPKRCSFAYMVDSPDVDTVNGECAICKFQKVDLIYKQILSIYSENAGRVSGIKLGDDSTKMIIFSSPCGGVGTSTVAASCALHFSQQNKRVLYLNLEKYGNSNCFFNAEGQFDMSDIIFAMKSKKANLSMKLESCVKQDRKGVYFYSPSKIALDMMEISFDDITRFITELKLTGSYDYIIVDTDFGLDKESISIYKKSHAFVWVGDGSEISNDKIIRAYQALSIMEQHAEAPLTQRMSLVYNKFSNKTGKMIGDIGLKNVGGAPRFEHATTQQVMENLSKLDAYEKLI